METYACYDVVTGATDALGSTMDYEVNADGQEKSALSFTRSWRQTLTYDDTSHSFGQKYNFGK